jgi:hypothetical protein
MSFPSTQAIAALKAWHKDSRNVYVHVDSKTLGAHQFWGRVAWISQTEVGFAGDRNFVPVPLTNCKFHYIGPDQIPESVRTCFKETDCCLFIRFERGSALLYGKQPKIENRQSLSA